MFDMLISDELQIGWNGIEPVVIVTFNERRTICKVFVVDGTGYTCFTRKRASGRFQYKFNPELIPSIISARAFNETAHTWQSIYESMTLALQNTQGA